MIPLVEAKRDELKELCRRYRVRRLDLFGSASTQRFDPQRSDLDFVVEFQRPADLRPADQYFGLLFALEELFARKVDLVCAGALRNPYFVREVNRTRVLLYAA